jgi:hypothetical protein
MSIEAALLPRNLSSHLLRFHFLRFRFPLTSDHAWQTGCFAIWKTHLDVSVRSQDPLETNR